MTDQIEFIGMSNMGDTMAEQIVTAGTKVKGCEVAYAVMKKAK